MKAQGYSWMQEGFGSSGRAGIDLSLRSMEDAMDRSARAGSAWLGVWHEQMLEGFTTLRALAFCKSWQEAMNLNNAFVRDSMARAQTLMRSGFVPPVPMGPRASEPKGERPSFGPAEGEPDDLKQINGVGPAVEKILNELGITRFAQIAAFSPEQIAWVDEHLKFKGRIEREGWITQAKQLAAAAPKPASASNGAEATA